ncbi:DNA-binding transcriptional regulator Fis [Aquisalimonas sp.]|uniref:DNA-binding transcriptional regulator Fis n=1 Tax=unclassified Aquisalimonas TaxID=2644645 RepID=UPI0025C25E20|nr:DNA-binding transcriptional regulator Fis [Aquisalimonas sp.]
MSEQVSRLQQADTHAEEEVGVGPIRACVDTAVRDYLRQLDGHDCTDIHALVLAEVEPPLLRAVLDHCQGNQTRAARLLGVNRGTLRKKLLQYDIQT